MMCTSDNDSYNNYYAPEGHGLWVIPRDFYPGISTHDLLAIINDLMCTSDDSYVLQKVMVYGEFPGISTS